MWGISRVTHWIIFYLLRRIKCWNRPVCGNLASGIGGFYGVVLFVCGLFLCFIFWVCLFVCHTLALDEEEILLLVIPLVGNLDIAPLLCSWWEELLFTPQVWTITHMVKHWLVYRKSFFFPANSKNVASFWVLGKKFKRLINIYWAYYIADNVLSAFTVSTLSITGRRGAWAAQSVEHQWKCFQYIFL